MGLWRRQDCHEVPEHGKAHLSPVGQVVQDPVQVVYAQLEVVPAHAERWQLALVQGEHAEPSGARALDPNLRADLAQPHQHESRLGRVCPGGARPEGRHGREGPAWASRAQGSCWPEGGCRSQRCSWSQWGSRSPRGCWSSGAQRTHSQADRLHLGRVGRLLRLHQVLWHHGSRHSGPVSWLQGRSTERRQGLRRQDVRDKEVQRESVPHDDHHDHHNEEGKVQHRASACRWAGVLHGAGSGLDLPAAAVRVSARQRSAADTVKEGGV
mmetsp:Transcript_1714/g.4433  ORF Transcript_1714/g.4433 Transcript_1714/m.4433 type:complete len:268 (+) Transcript_1714:644-1447(+)